MSNLTLIIITGLPCTGKTTFGKNLSEEIGFPFISKDNIREILFDNFGWSDQYIQKRISKANHDLLYYFVEQNLKVDQSVIIENVFKPEKAENRINKLKKRYCFNIIQIRLIAKGQTLYSRFKERANSKRHPGHGDIERLEEWKSYLMRGMVEPLQVGGDLIDIDTNDFENVDFETALDAIKSAISK